MNRMMVGGAHLSYYCYYSQLISVPPSITANSFLKPLINQGDTVESNTIWLSINVIGVQT